MKRVYWRPNRISKHVLLTIGLVTVAGTLVIEAFPARRVESGAAEMRAAAVRAEAGMEAIRQVRIARGHRIDAQFDPARSGMIGTAMSEVTSLPSHLESKQTSVNPNFAAAVVRMLTEAGVESGDVVAVGYTGSFPAFNVCVCAALETLKAKPVVIHSAASSQFGANLEEMMWLDMETAMYDAGVISFRSNAATLGGFGDRARGMSEGSRRKLREAIARNGVSELRVRNLRDSIRKRMEFYAEHAGGTPIAAYVNVGGGAASIHGDEGKEALGVGLVLDSEGIADANDASVDCVASRFARAGVPVVQMSDALRLARKFDQPIAPQVTPVAGEGPLYERVAPRRALALALLVGIALVLRSYLWSGFWAQVAARWTAKRERAGGDVLPIQPVRAELMV